MKQEIYDFIRERCKSNSKLNLNQVKDNIEKIIQETSIKFNISIDEATNYYKETSYM